MTERRRQKGASPKGNRDEAATRRGRSLSFARDRLACASAQESRSNARAEEHDSAQESSPAQRHDNDLKKRTQSAAARTSAKISVIKNYDDMPPVERDENKAKRSRSVRLPEEANAGKVCGRDAGETG